MPSATLRNRLSLRLRALRLVGRARARKPTLPGLTPARVLLLRPDHIGDVLLTSPAIALLRESLPAAHLTYVVGPWSVDVARAGPPVESLRTLAFPGFTRRPNAHVLAPYALLLREATRLRREGYDLAIVLRPDHWWGALLALTAGIPVRVGVRTPETSPLLTHARSPVPGQHAASAALALARFALATCHAPAVEAAAPRPIFRLTAAHRSSARAFWADHSLDGRKVVALAPTAGAVLKSWPVRRWVKLAQRLRAQGVAVLLVGAPADQPLLSAIQARMTPAGCDAAVLTASGQPLGLSAALFERCAVLVGLDGGQAHLASAVGTPTVRLYGPASSTAFGPWPPDTDQAVLVARGLSCVPCGQLEHPPCGATALPACLLALSVDEVLNLVSAQLERH